ncbi:response regulator [Aestuariibius sp. 2305UL40-4]|uniref:response regulator n=1 Tax=Aestuariibius violaceus TaxID=3234132 RepID=UPI00345E3C08
MDDLQDFMFHQTPTADRPLLGTTILVVEDSRFACEALRLLALRSGARIRRADCLTAAQRHLKTYRPTVAIVDHGLPDGSGAELIRELAGAVPRIPVILGMSGDDGAEEAALEAGADGFLSKPVARLSAFQQALLAHLPPDRHPTGPRALSQDEIAPDPVAYRDDVARAAEILSTRRDEATVAYLRQFLAGCALSANDRPMGDALADLARERRPGGPTPEQTAKHLSGLMASRIAGIGTL